MVLIFAALWFIDTLLLIAATPRMEGWALVSVIALYSAAAWEGSLYYNGVIAELAMKK